ncbi:MAG TPA: hypothetical protein VHX65_08080 [Pirellulales bacterium]|jgi:hypothetical protein|nr:hypothetical protein [Pirellulales bacterium]
MRYPNLIPIGAKRREHGKQPEPPVAMSFDGCQKKRSQAYGAIVSFFPSSDACTALTLCRRPIKDATLPTYERPPVVETVLGIQLDPIAKESPPLRIVPDVQGGIVFEFEWGQMFESLHIPPVSNIEYRVFNGNRHVSRGPWSDSDPT